MSAGIFYFVAKHSANTQASDKKRRQAWLFGKVKGKIRAHPAKNQQKAAILPAEKAFFEKNSRRRLEKLRKNAILSTF